MIPVRQRTYFTVQPVNNTFVYHILVNKLLLQQNKHELNVKDKAKRGTSQKDIGNKA